MPATRHPKRPYVICHMGPSIDGRIVIDDWDVPRSFVAEYERTAQTYDADAWMIGRVSMEPYAGKAKLPKTAPPQPLPRTDFIATHSASSYVVALDPSGKLTWKSNAIDGEHVVSILTESVPDSYLAFLRSKGISYLFGGKTQLNLARVLQKLRSKLGIHKLMLEGGGKINGTFLTANLIDELSLLIAPIADGGTGTPTLFDAKEGKGPARRLKLLSVEQRPGDLLWLRYKVRR